MSWRVLAAAMMLVVACSAAGCRKAEEGDLRVIVIGDTEPRVVDPAAGPLTEPEAVLLGNVAQGLVRFDATGQIVPGIAERWNVTDDGLSYIFRLQSGEWPGGRKITAEQVARLLRRQLVRRSGNRLKDTLGAVDRIVAMTDRVIEISLKAPRPNLLQVLAQPEFSIVYQDQGAGPFQLSEDRKNDGTVGLVRSVTDEEREATRREEILLSAAEAPAAIGAFVRNESDLVLGGSYSDLPYARAVDLPRNSLRFDPAIGLFGLVAARADGPLAELEVRRLLSEAIDRQALIDALNVPGLLPRATILEPGLDGVPDPVPPQWTSVPIAERRPALSAAAARQFGSLERPTIRIALPDTPGAKILLNRLSSDWGVLGIKVEAATGEETADLRLIDEVAPSTTPAWYLRQVRCGEVAICDPALDELLESARAATIAAQRNALLAQAASLIDEQHLFIAIAAPIRWSLVSTRVQGFAANRFARHTLTGLGQQLDRQRNE
jgi:oligopeptide transport system substrate-binding protein